MSFEFEDSNLNRFSAPAQNAKPKSFVSGLFLKMGIKEAYLNFVLIGVSVAAILLTVIVIMSVF